MDTLALTMEPCPKTSITVSDRPSALWDIAKATYRFNIIFVFGQMRTWISLRIDSRPFAQRATVAVVRIQRETILLLVLSGSKEGSRRRRGMVSERLCPAARPFNRAYVKFVDFHSL